VLGINLKAILILIRILVLLVGTVEQPQIRYGRSPDISAV
jgi:hypothetical protein